MIVCFAFSTLSAERGNLDKYLVKTGENWGNLEKSGEIWIESGSPAANLDKKLVKSG